MRDFENPLFEMLGEEHALELIDAVAAAFKKRLIAEVGEEDFASIIEKNKALPGTSILDSSHDFCDTNRVMLDAYEDCMDIEPDPMDEADNQLMAEAWGKVLGYRGWDAGNPTVRNRARAKRESLRISEEIRADSKAYLKAAAAGISRPQDMLRNDSAEELGEYIEGLDFYRGVSVNEFIRRHWGISLPTSQNDLSEMPMESEVGKACMELALRIDDAVPHCLDYQRELYGVAIRQMQCFAYG